MSIITGFLLSVILIKNLQVKEFGEYSFYISFIVIFGSLFNLGLESVIQRYVPEFIVKKKFGKINRLIIISLFIRVFLIIFFCIILFINFDFLKRIFQLTISTTSFLIFLTILFFDRIKNLIGLALLTAFLEAYKERLNFIFYQIFRLILLSYVVINGYSLKELLIAWLLLETLSLFHFIFLFSKKILIKKKKIVFESFTNNENNRILKYGKTNALALALFIFADLAVDNLMLGYFLNQEAVGFYMFAMSILLIVIKISPTSILKGTLGVFFTKLYTKKKLLNDIKLYYGLITKLNLIVTFPMLTVLMINLENIINIIYSENYLITIPLIYLGAFFVIISSNNSTFSPLLQALEKNKLFLYAGIFSIYNLIGNIILIPIYGTYGAMFATGSSGVFIFIFYFFQFKKVFKNEFFPWKTLFNILISCFPILFLGKYLNEFIHSIYSLIIVILIQVIVYYFFIKFFKLFSLREKKIINKQLGIRFFKF